MLMAVMVPMPREKWTDERLDDLNKKVNDGFARLDGDIRELRNDLNSQVNGLRGEMNARFERVDARFDALNRNLLASAVAIIAAILGSNAF
jgi:uncharacterized coiled-coil DUF342 family protein